MGSFHTSNDPSFVDQKLLSSELWWFKFCSFYSIQDQMIKNHSFTERHLRNRKSCWDKRENILKNKIPLFQWSINQKPQSPQAYSDSRTITTNSTNPPLTKYLKKKKKELPKNQTNQLVNRYAKSNSKTSYDTLFPLLDLMENKESGEGTRTSFPSRR